MAAYDLDVSPLRAVVAHFLATHAFQYLVRPEMLRGEKFPIGGFPKPSARVLDKDLARRAASKNELMFKKLVWLRDGGKCRACGRPVIKTLELTANRGEVHHRRGRNVAPEDKYNPDAAVLLCALCHKDPLVIARFRRMG